MIRFNTFQRMQMLLIFIILAAMVFSASSLYYQMKAEYTLRLEENNVQLGSIVKDRLDKYKSFLAILGNLVSKKNVSNNPQEISNIIKSTNLSSVTKQDSQFLNNLSWYSVQKNLAINRYGKIEQNDIYNKIYSSIRVHSDLFLITSTIIAQGIIDDSNNLEGYLFSTLDLSFLTENVKKSKDLHYNLQILTAQDAVIFATDSVLNDDYFLSLTLNIPNYPYRIVSRYNKSSFFNNFLSLLIDRVYPIGILGILIYLQLVLSYKKIRRELMSDVHGEVEAISIQNQQLEDKYQTIANQNNQFIFEQQLREKLDESEKVTIKQRESLISQINKKKQEYLQKIYVYGQSIVQTDNLETFANLITQINQKAEMITYAICANDASVKISFEGILTDVLELYCHKLQSDKIEIIKNIAPDLPDIIIDEVFLRQLLASILAYTIKGMGKNGVIRINAMQKFDSNNTITLTIADNGFGFTKDQLKSVSVWGKNHEAFAYIDLDWEQMQNMANVTDATLEELSAEQGKIIMLQLPICKLEAPSYAKFGSNVVQLSRGNEK